MRSSLITALLSVAAAVSMQAQDFNWHGRLAAGKRLEVKGVNGDVRAVLASGGVRPVSSSRFCPASNASFFVSSSPSTASRYLSCNST